MMIYANSSIKEIMLKIGSLTLMIFLGQAGLITSVTTILPKPNRGFSIVEAS